MPKHLAEKILTSKAALEGERKQVTVLFADLKGSMELLADRDPEEARKLLDPVLEHMMEAVHRYEGTVNQVMGDGIMALFGAPLAHEDHAVRACYAALRMQELVKRYADGVFRMYGVPIRIRIGLNSGEVVVRSIGSDLRMDYTAVGQTTHLAARMEQIADPGAIRLTANTLHLAEGFVQAQSLGAMPVKGLAAPVEVYELEGASPIRSRLQAAASRGLTTFVGRDVEMNTLFTALENAKAGKGQVVAVVGEPGVGKSRLYWEFTRSHRTHGCLILEAVSVSYGRATTYLPVIDLLKRYAQIEPWDDGRKIREKVTGKIFTLDRALEHCLAPILSLLDAPVDDTEWERLDPVRRRHRLHEAVRQLLLREARERPVLLVFEDLHWIDGETQVLLDGLVEGLPTTCMCLLVNYRPEYRHGWGSRTYYTRVRLDTLPPVSTGQLLSALLGSDPSVSPLVPTLIARTDGNPFFLEETVQILVEAGALRGERGAYQLVRTLGSLDMPPTVQAILSARIDRLASEDKWLLQTAAVIGKDVPYPLLQAMAELDDAALRAGLARLQEAEFLYEVQLFPDLEHTFKHALTHEVAYGTLLGDRRRALDARIVSAIERLYPDRSVAQLERLAYHALRGKVWDKALMYAREAGARALDRSALAEALTYSDHALEALTHLGAVPERKTLEFLLVTQRATALRELRGYAAPEVERIYLRARELCREMRDVPERVGLEWQQMQFFLVRADLDTAKQLASSLLHHAEASRESALLIDANLAVGMTAFATGDFATARNHFERALELYHPDADQPRLLTHGQCPGVFCLGYLAWTLWFQGWPDRAATCVNRAVALAKQKAHSFTYVSALTFAARVYQGRRETAYVRRFAAEIVALAREEGFAYYEAQGLIHEGWARVLLEGDEAGYAQLQQGCTALEKTGTVLALPGVLVQAAEACQKLGRLDEAQQTLNRIPAASHGSRTRCWDAEIARLNAELAAHGARQDLAAARQWYRTALATARAQAAQSLELRAALSYARASLSQMDDHEARERLAEIVSAFSERANIVELDEAHGVLSARASGRGEPAR
jgi:class 3 adenylate cyclase/predicted ATPase